MWTSKLTLGAYRTGSLLLDNPFDANFLCLFSLLLRVLEMSAMRTFCGWTEAYRTRSLVSHVSTTRRRIKDEMSSQAGPAVGGQ